ncbi:MAG: hypothetical protein JSS49_26610 [Planctomycetes bacterium]|nr:hypothetical protein [Planctomycetota bacterium]
MLISLTLDRQTYRFDSDTIPIRIGTAADNEISRPDDARLAPVHAVIRSINGRWMAESSGKVQIRIGNRRPVPFAWLNPGDVIRLTEAGPDVIFEALVPLSLPVDNSPAEQSELPDRNQPATGTRHGISPLVLGAVLAPLILVGVLWGMWPRPAAKNIAMNSSETTPEPIADPVTQPTETVPPSDPSDFLVLIGIGDLASDNRPHLLGVGWLYDEQTVVVPRFLGDMLNELVAATQRDGAPRQACAIQGIPLEVRAIDSPSGCRDVSLLRLTQPAVLTVPARDRWLNVTAADIERRRAKASAKPIRYVSYATLPRFSGSQGKHGLSLLAYDPELVRTTVEDARFLYEERRHLLKSADPATRPERGGLLVDEENRILGMILLDSSVLWTSTLQDAFRS